MPGCCCYNPDPWQPHLHASAARLRLMPPMHAPCSCYLALAPTGLKSIFRLRLEVANAAHRTAWEPGQERSPWCVCQSKYCKGRATARSMLGLAQPDALKLAKKCAAAGAAPDPSFRGSSGQTVLRAAACAHTRAGRRTATSALPWRLVLPAAVPVPSLLLSSTCCAAGHADGLLHGADGPAAAWNAPQPCWARCTSCRGELSRCTACTIT